MKQLAPEVKNVMAALKSRMATRGATSESIVNEFIKNHSDTVARENIDLQRIALMKIVQDVGKSKKGPVSSVQFEMFAEYGIERTVMVASSDGQKKHRKIETLTVSEARDYVEEHIKPKTRLSPRVKEMTRLLDTIEPYSISDRSTVGDCWKAYRKTSGG